MASLAPATAAGAAVSQPCANAVTVPIAGMEFFRCGTTWYREAYGPCWAYVRHGTAAGVLMIRVASSCSRAVTTTWQAPEARTY
jgi:hypothetical protein